MFYCGVDYIVAQFLQKDMIAICSLKQASASYCEEAHVQSHGQES